MSITAASVKNRIALERKIVKALVKAALDAGYFCGVHDGEQLTLKHCDNISTIMEHLFTTDEDCLRIYDKNTTVIGWVRLVYGNDGWDVICDYTTNLEPLMAEPNKISEAAQ